MADLNGLGPIIPNLPAATGAYANKYPGGGLSAVRPLGPPGIPDYVLRALQRIDQQRVAGGSPPTSLKDTPNLLAAGADPNVLPTPPRQRGGSLTDVPGNTIDDARTIVKSLAPTNLVKGIAHEVGDLLDGLDDDLHDAAKAPNIVAGISNLPLIRLLPGAFTVNRLASGDFRAPLEHPLFTALDLLPFAQKAAAGTAVVQAAEDSARVAEEAGRFTPKVRPISTFLTKSLDDAGELQPAKLGPLTDKLASTPTGQFLSRAFGQMSRDTSSLVARFNERLGEMQGNRAAPEFTDHITALADEFTQLATDPRKLQENFGITPDRAAEITQALGENEGKVADLTASLPPNEQQFVDSILRARDTLDAHKVSEGIVHDLNGELYEPDVARRFGNRQRITAQRLGKVFSADGMKATVTERVIRDLYNGDPERWDGALSALEDPTLPDQLRLQAMKDAFSRAGRSLTRPAETHPYGTEFGMTWNEVTNRARNDVTRALNSVKREGEFFKGESPARFDELINRKTVERYAERNSLNPDQVSALFDANHRGIFDDVEGFDKAEWARARAQVTRTWQDMKAAGAEPQFIARVSPREAEQIMYPKVVEKIPSLKAAKARVADISPTVQDATVSIAHEAGEILKRRVGTDLADTLGQRYGVAEADLRRRFLPAAELEASYDKRLNVGTRLDQMMREHYTPYHPDQIFPFAGNQGATAKATQLWIPKGVSDVIRQMHDAGWTNLGGTAVDAATGAMRTSLLPLSPRWHVFNIIGGATMLGATADVRAFAKLGQGWEIAKAAAKGEVPDWLPEELRSSLGSFSRDEAELRFRSGSTIRRWFEQSQAGRNAIAATEGARAAGGKLIQKSFDFNQLFDDAYRATAYLYGHDEAITKGLTAEQAQRAGVGLAKKVLQDVNSLTPFERNILRPIFPFYSFNGHMVRWAMNFPFDHPYRAAIVAGVGRQLLDGMGGDSNPDMLDAFIFGKPDAEGNRKGINQAGINPFTDVGDLFTLGGWVGALNPVGKVIAESLGVDTSTGQADLYPNLRYDPTTGKLAAQTTNPLLNLLYSSIPQSQIVGDLLGTNQEFRQLLRQNPDAAMRLLRSQGGLPVVLRDFNPTEDQIKREQKRSDTQSEVLKDAMKSGNYDEAQQYPGLSAVLDRLASLTPAQLQAFRQQQAGSGEGGATNQPVGGGITVPSGWDLVKGSLIRL